ncbi:MAG: hypothetical protein RTU30_02880 [Candidatus Thorarchaeota archaeon]
MNIEGVIIFEVESGIPLFSRLRADIDPSLFSSFISAIGHFSGELALGGLTSFSTADKVVYLAPGKTTVTALISPKKAEFHVASQMADDLGRQFESRFDVPDTPQPRDYDSFSDAADEFLNRMEHPFLSQVAIFLHTEYHGDVSIKPKMMKRTGSFEEVDMLIRQRKRSDSVYEIEPGFKYDDLTIVKAIDGSMTRGELVDFFDSTEQYAVRVMNGDEMEFRPIFPSNVVVVARDFATNIPDLLERLPRNDGRPFIDGTHMYVGMPMKVVDSDYRCYVDLWRWRNDGPPEKIFG